MRRHPYWLIKNRRDYTLNEIAKILGVHVRTVQSWRIEGMPIINQTRPYLINGAELKRYLSSKGKGRGIKLEPHEFRCFRCGCAVRSVKSAITFEEKERSLGKSEDNKQIIVRGVCSRCGGKVARLSSTNKVDRIHRYYQSSTGNSG